MLGATVGSLGAKLGVLFRLLLRMFNGGKVFGRFWCAANVLSNQKCYPGVYAGVLISIHIPWITPVGKGSTLGKT